MRLIIMRLNDVQLPGFYVNFDHVAVLQFSYCAAGGSFGADVTDGKAGGAARKAAVGYQCAGFVEAHGFQIGRGVQHLLHSRTAFGSFEEDGNHVAGLDRSVEDAFNSLLLGTEDPGRTGEFLLCVRHTGGFYYGSITGEVAVKNRQSAILTVGTLHTADAARYPIRVRGIEIVFL